MKTLFSNLNFRLCLLMSGLFLLSISNESFAQIIKNFTQRTLPATPNRKIYNIRGDYQIIGNTNLTTTTPVTNSSTNSNESMSLVDMDNDNTTANSSMSTLTFSNENGALNECTNVVYAGLYWTGRTHDGTNVNVPLSNTVTNSVNDTITYSLTNSSNSFNSQTFSVPLQNTGNIGSVDYHRVRYQFGTSNNSAMQYEFLVRTSATGTPQYVIRYRQSNSTNNNAASNNYTTVSASNVTFSVTGNVVTANITGVSFVIGGVTYYLSQLTRDIRTNGSLTNYQSGTGGFNTSTASLFRINVTTNSKTLHKQYVRIKGPGATSYDSIQANPSNIHYPGNTDDQSGIYAAYADVTNYVKQRGVGEYWVADVAVNTGDGGSVGYFGGWALVVVYENTKMEWRDVTIFDGYGYISKASATANGGSFLLPVKGFKARQNGPVKVKMGFLAGEGDRSITGDYFRIWNQTTSSFQNLTHSGNTATNFFNSNINVGASVTRLPDYTNNTGLDVSMFYLNNDSLEIIKNNDDSTTFQFGTNIGTGDGDTYVIPLIVFGVDAYIPDIAPINQVAFVNNVPVTQSTTIFPGDTVTYKLIVKNNGSEGIDSAQLKIAVPFSANYLDMSANYYLTTGNKPAPVFNPLEGVNGTINWGIIDSIPKPLPNQNDTFAVLTYRMIATTDCYQLMNPLCQPTMAVDGFAKGVGSISRTRIDSFPFIFGLIQNGNCFGDPITQPQVMTIDGTAYVLDNCGQNEQIIKFVECDENATGVYPLDANVTQWFPAGSRYYNEYPVTNAAIEYTAATGIPYTANGNTVNYYAIPPSTSDECVFRFSLTVNETPDLLSYTYNCATAEVQVNSTITNTTYRVDTIYANPTYWTAIPKPAANTTGYFNNLKGADSLVVSLINGVCEMPFTLTFEDCENPLPVEFVDFTAVKNNDKVDIKWTVAKEVNVGEYIIERSGDGRKFEAIQHVKPSTASTHVKQYSGVDNEPLVGQNYYRIKQVDLDGTSMYSIIRTVEFDGKGLFNPQLFPNPTASDINLTFNASHTGILEYWVINNVSQITQTTQTVAIEKGKNTIQLKVSSLADGVYFLAIKSNNGDDVQYLKFVKKSGK